MADELTSPPIVPAWTPEEKALWLDLLDSFSNSLMSAEPEEPLLDRDGKKKEERALNAVIIAARCADQAIREYQFREYSQQAPEAAGDLTPEEQFHQFTEWLEKSCSKRNRRPIRSTGR